MLFIYLLFIYLVYTIKLVFMLFLVIRCSIKIVYSDIGDITSIIDDLLAIIQFELNLLLQQNLENSNSIC